MKIQTFLGKDRDQQHCIFLKRVMAFLVLKAQFPLCNHIAIIIGLAFIRRIESFNSLIRKTDDAAKTQAMQDECDDKVKGII